MRSSIWFLLGRFIRSSRVYLLVGTIVAVSAIAVCWVGLFNRWDGTYQGVVSIRDSSAEPASITIVKNGQSVVLVTHVGDTKRNCAVEFRRVPDLSLVGRAVEEWQICRGDAKVLFSHGELHLDGDSLKLTASVARQTNDAPEDQLFAKPGKTIQFLGTRSVPGDARFPNLFASDPGERGNPPPEDWRDAIPLADRAKCYSECTTCEFKCSHGPQPAATAAAAQDACLSNCADASRACCERLGSHIPAPGCGCAEDYHAGSYRPGSTTRPEHE